MALGRPRRRGTPGRSGVGARGRASVLTEYRDDMALLRRSASFGGGSVFPNPT